MKARSVLVLLMLLARSAWALTGPERHFVEKVKPLLDSRCVSCHGADKVKGGLRLDSRDALLKGGETGPAIAPGKPGDSLLLQAVMHTRRDLEMPPKEKLTPGDVAALEQWIREGAVWPELERSATQMTPSAGESIGNAWTDPRNPIVRIFGGQRLDLWSLKPITHPNPPSVHRQGSVRNPIDSFVLAQLEEHKLSPSPEANRRTLARRLYFDLTGLPPTPAEINAFLEDEDPGAYEKLVDKLLDSPRYGEQAARQWLDVIRYSDSNGFDWDEFRPKAWRFRDYVIRSFNQDKPFDQFIREQIAGDELLDGPPATQGEQDALIATGYLRLGPHDNSAAAFNEQARSRAELMMDLVETTGSAFLGLTMACCRCHDHKYDPLSQADHYRMRAFFEGVKFADDLPLDLEAEQTRIREQHRGIEAQIKPIEEKREAILKKLKSALRNERTARLAVEDRKLLSIPAENQSPDQKEKIADLEKKITPSDKEVMATASEADKKQLDGFSKAIDDLKKKKLEFTLGLLMTDAEGTPPATRILYQGDYKAERTQVEPGFISVLDPNPAVIHRGRNSKSLGRRLTLADWIASTNNPLTARVLVNRVWQNHFGQGIVATPNDLGLAGGRPSNPALLDWLASEFMRRGWSFKQLERLILTSATYRMASSPAAAESPRLIKIGQKHKSEAVASNDSENRLLARQNLRRLTAEQLRDALLAVSGQLKNSSGGPPVWPELPPEILVANPAFLDDNAEKTKGWYPSKPEEQNVRSIFLIQKRTVRVPFMETFDIPENATSCPRRMESVVAPQALSLLNSPFAVQAAREFARRVQREAGTNPDAQVRRAFNLAYQRSPAFEELKACTRLIEARGLPELCRALLNANEFLYID